MEKIFDFGCIKGSTTSRGNENAGGERRQRSVTAQKAYHIRQEHLGWIHKAAVEGNAKKVKKILWLRVNGMNDKDKMKRTALHLACANGHVEVVALLTDRRCLLNLQDNDNRTALIKAIQCQEEECATILLDCGADTNVKDIDGNTALHHAVLDGNTSIVAKLLSERADIEAKNKDGLTPLALAQAEDRKEMVNYLIERGAKVDTLKRSESDKTENDSLSSLPNETGIDNSRPISDDDNIVLAPKDGLTPLALAQAEDRKEMVNYLIERGAKVDTLKRSESDKTENDSLSSLSNGHGINNSWLTSDDDNIVLAPKNKMKPCLTKLWAAFQGSKETGEATKPENEKKVKIPPLKFIDDDDTDSPWDTESFSENPPQNDAHHLPEDKDQKGKTTPSGQVKDQETNVANVADTGSVGVPVAHIDSPEKKSDIKLVQPANEVNDSPTSKKEVEVKSVETSKSDSSSKLDLKKSSKKEQVRLRRHEDSHSQVSGNHNQGINMFQEVRILQDEINKLKLELERVKIQKQEMENKNIEEIAIVKASNNFYQKTINLNEEAFKQTISEYNMQLNVLRAETAKLKSKLETVEQERESLKEETESYRLRLAAAVQDQEESQILKRNLQLDFQKEREEWIRIWKKMTIDVSDLTERNEILSQLLSEANNKSNNLEVELQGTRNALKETTLSLENIQKDLNQTQHEKQQIEQMYQKEQEKVKTYVEEQSSIGERLADLQRENTRLQQQLEDERNKTARTEITAIRLQEKLWHIMEVYQAKSDQEVLMLNEMNEKLIDKCVRLKERINQYKTSKEDKAAGVGHFQQELADTLRKQTMLEIPSVVTQEIMKKVDKISSELQDARDQCKDIVRCTDETRDNIKKLDMENAKFKLKIAKHAYRGELFQTNRLVTNSDEKDPFKNYTEFNQSMDQKLKKNSELEKEITGNWRTTLSRKLREGAAKFEPLHSRPYLSGLTDHGDSYKSLHLKNSQAYENILKKKYMM